MAEFTEAMGAIERVAELQKQLAAATERAERLRSNCVGAQADNIALRKALDHVRMALEAQHARHQDQLCPFCGVPWGVVTEAHDELCPRYVIGKALCSLNNGAALLTDARAAQ